MKRKLDEEKVVRDMQLKEHSSKKTEETRIERVEEERRRVKMDAEAYEQKQREIMKIMDYRKQCQVQFEENRRLKELQKLKDQEASMKVPNGTDLMGQLFQEKRNISLERRKITD